MSELRWGDVLCAAIDAWLRSMAEQTGLDQISADVDFINTVVTGRYGICVFTPALATGERAMSDDLIDRLRHHYKQRM
ncbi:hypothetical protein [uncultured Paracoccus sp.]|uniref:hypothetical protein n=1 Tax=uncultured Paracoccus sp. TaxID=189685 RepID=UPI002599DF7C|nr:hypothetical protein [uncultured Paracoccus sp.]